MLRLYFENELTELSDDLVSIWTSVLVQYYVLLEEPTENQCQEVIDNDLLINESVVALDEKCQAVICLQHPVTEDLRRIVTMMKLNTDIERIGDRLVDMARVVHTRPLSQEWQEVFDEIQVLQLAVRDQLKKALLYYQSIQTKTERLFDPRRQEITDYYQGLEQKIISRLANDRDYLDVGVGFLETIQYLDKISNLIGSMYKWMAYQRTGKIE